MDLKWLLVRRIALIALACLIAGTALALYDTARSARQRNVDLAEAVSRQLDVQLWRIGSALDIPKRFPDWELVTSYALQPGQCVEFSSSDASRRRSSCAGIDSISLRVPDWFVAAYDFVIWADLSASKAISHRGVAQGTIHVDTIPTATAAQAWETIAPIFTFCAALVALLCVATYFAIDRALRPTKDILAGLNRLAQGNLACRLPAFRLAELNRISEVFNALSEDLSKATAERAELARRLVDTQEQERRHIARELHDEIAQKLAALNALAACIRTSAQAEAPGLVVEARELEKMATGLMVSLRRTLTYLRPQEIDDLGLVQSLKSLVEQHNMSASGRTTYSIETTGEVEQLKAETSAHVYRIVQEALTNAAKHANARNVRVLLSQLADTGQEKIRLSVVDDGAGPSARDKLAASAGAGLIGMRERVAALSGKFVAGPLPAGGFGLQVEFPTFQRGA
jgi:two-component system sensor histidine kinase UhpB